MPPISVNGRAASEHLLWYFQTAERHFQAANKGGRGIACIYVQPLHVPTDQRYRCARAADGLISFSVAVPMATVTSRRPADPRAALRLHAEYISTLPYAYQTKQISQ